MKPGPKIPEITDAEISLLLKEKGMTDLQVARRYGVSRMTVSRRRSLLGIPRKPKGVMKKPLSLEQNDSIQELYRQGKNDYEVAAELHIGRTRLREWRKLNEVPSHTNKKGLSDRIADILRDVATDTYSRVAEKYGVTRSSISKIAKKHGISRDPYRPGHVEEMSDYLLTDRQKEILVGDLFGDGGLVPTSSFSAYFQFAQCMKQEMFSLWKAREFKPLTTHITYSYRLNKVTVGGSTCKELGALYKDFYGDGTYKNLQVKHAHMLTPLGLAVWYMGDGSISRNTGLFHVGLQIDLVPIADIVSKIFNFEVWPRRYAKEWHLRVMDPDRFFEIVVPHMLPNFSYKIPEKYLYFQKTAGNLMESLRQDLAPMIIGYNPELQGNQ